MWARCHYSTWQHLPCPSLNSDYVVQRVLVFRLVDMMWSEWELPNSAVPLIFRKWLTWATVPGHGNGVRLLLYVSIGAPLFISYDLEQPTRRPLPLTEQWESVAPKVSHLPEFLLQSFAYWPHCIIRLLFISRHVHHRERMPTCDTGQGCSSQSCNDCKFATLVSWLVSTISPHSYTGSLPQMQQKIGLRICHIRHNLEKK